MYIYGIVPLELWQDHKLSRNARYLYAYFCSRAGKNTCCYPTRATIKQDTDLSYYIIDKAVKELVSNNYIKIENHKNCGRFSNNVYFLTSRVESVEKGESFFKNPDDSITNSPCTNDSVTVDCDTNKNNTNKNINNKIIDNIACTPNKKDLNVERSSMEKKVCNIIEFFENKKGKKENISKHVRENIKKAIKKYGYENIQNYISNTFERWSGTKYENGLKLSTLFGNKFEKYYNFKSVSDYLQNQSSPKSSGLDYLNNDNIDKYSEFINDF